MTTEHIIIGLGCFWGAEKLYWNVPGVITTTVGYAGGNHPNPTYREVCTGTTGHAEVVHIEYDPQSTTVAELLKIGFENHDPTQGNRQGNDIGPQYRSCVYTTTDEQYATAVDTIDNWRSTFLHAGFGNITTHIAPLQEVGDGKFYPAEEYHQKYLHKNPGGYCNHGPHGVSCSI